MFRYLPEQASEHAPEVDWIHNWLTDLSVFFTVAIVGTMIYFAVRYRRRGDQDHETPRIEGNNTLEVIWTVVPTLVCVWVAYYGIVIYQDMVHVPDNGEPVEEVYVRARKWAWDFEYPNGKKTTNEVVLPVDRYAKLIIRSSDVLHSFFVPAMRVKRDAVPGMYTSVSFKPVATGEYQTFCAEYCGMDHSQMLAKLRVVSQAEYQRWLEAPDENAGLPPEERGRQLYTEKGCNACHSLSGQRIIGPSFLNIWGEERKFTDGSTGVVDENYLEESILAPNAKIVQGFPANQMPAFEGLLDEEQVTSLIAFIKSVDESTAAAPAAAAPAEEPAADLPPAERGKQLYQTKLCVTCHSLDGSQLIGPTFKGLWMKKGTLADGSEYTADEAYIEESILDPNAHVVQGFQPGMMPPGLLTKEQVPDIIEFIKTLE